eukprot:1115061-Pyramimonas_sp.AAC.1
MRECSAGSSGLPPARATAASRARWRSAAPWNRGHRIAPHPPPVIKHVTVAIPWTCTSRCHRIDVV